MKKFLAFLLVVVMATAMFASCDLEETIIVGYTIYKPMNYEEGNELVGFDTELAKAVFEKLGYKVKFKKIEWDNKYTELNSGNIDCIWNGFTANATDDDGKERKDKVDFSYNYMLNRQVIVTSKEKAANVTGKESFKDMTCAVEKGSAGETYLDKKLEIARKKTVSSQLDAMKDLSLGNADFVVLDEQLALAYVGEGAYADFEIVTSLSTPDEYEYYAIGFKKGSALTAEVNRALEELAADGTIDRIAKKYDLSPITDFSDQK